MDSGRNPVLMATSQLSPLSHFTQQSLYSPSQVDNQMIYRDYAAAAAAYLSPAHTKHVIGTNQTNGANGIFAANSSNSTLSAINIPVPPPAHHQSSSSSHHGSLTGGTLAVNPVNSHSSYSYSHGLAPVPSSNPLPAHLQQTSTHSYPLHGTGTSNMSNTSTMSAIQFSQPNYSANYIGAIQPLATASGKAPQYSNLYQFFAE